MVHTASLTSSHQQQHISQTLALNHGYFFGTTQSLIEDATERIDVMCRQDNDSYHVVTTSTPNMKCDNDNDGSNEMAPLNRHRNLIDFVDCRGKMTKWCFDLISFCQFHGETAELAMSILDRFVWYRNVAGYSSNHKDPSSSLCININDTHYDMCTDAKIYQLAAMTAMYTAIKLQEPASFDPQIVSEKLSRDAYTPKQIEDMEAVILETLQWKMNPPTISAYITELMTLITPTLLSNGDASKAIVNDPYTKQAFHNLISRQIQFVTLNYNMITVPTYLKAYCILSNALHIYEVPNHVLNFVDSIFMNVLDQKTLVNTNYCHGTNQFYSHTLSLRRELYEQIKEDCSYYFPSFTLPDSRIHPRSFSGPSLSFNDSISANRSVTPIMGTRTQSSSSMNHNFFDYSVGDDTSTAKKRKYPKQNPAVMGHESTLVSPMTA